MKLSNSKLILIILTVFCLVMVGVTTVRDEWLSPLRNTVGYFLMPVQSGMNTVGRAMYNNIKERERLRSALSENERLQQRVDALELENTRLQQDELELSRLRSLFELSSTYGQ